MNRRGFLKRTAAAGAALAAPAVSVDAQSASQRTTASTTPIMSAVAENANPPDADGLTADRTGSDFMVDVLKSLGLDYICANPGSSFRGLHESVINYGSNSQPELITCCHEESSVAMGHGYAKVEGKPIGVFAHGTVGLQHAAMAIYNAWCDRVPVYIMLGNQLDATMRRPGAEWAHSVQDAAAMVRDYTKWDDTPMSLPHFAESAVRAYKIALTPPMAPVVLVVNSEMQEHALAGDAKIAIPKLAVPSAPQGDSGAVAEAARLLVAAEHPVIVADRVARTPAAMKHLVELAETLQAAVIDQGGRMNFPTRHPLNQSQARAIADADVILGLELSDFWGVVNSYRDQLNRTTRSVTRPGAKLISITSGDLYMKSNYQDFQRYAEVDLAIAADAEATLPPLIEAVKRQMTGDRKRVFENRGAKLAEAGRGELRLGREPGEHCAAVRRNVGTDQERGLGARQRHRRRMGAPFVELRQAVSVDWWIRRRRRRLRCAGGRRRGARPQETRAARGEHPERRRSDVRARRAVDRGASSDSAAQRDAQQPRVSSGADARAEDVQPP